MGTLLTPQHLFGDAAQPGEFMGTGFLERATYEHDRGNTARQELAFGGYLIARLVDAVLDRRSPGTGTALQSQVDACATYVGQLSPHASETRHLTAILQEVAQPALELSRLELRLMIYAQFLEYHGRLDEALQILALSIQLLSDEAPPADRIVYALGAGKLNRLMARWEAAHRCYDAAENTGIITGNESLRLRGLGGKGAVARGQGDLAEARRIIEACARESAGQQQRLASRTRYIIYADMGAVYNLLDLRQEASEAQRAALRFTTNPIDRVQALGECALGRIALGEYEHARSILESVRLAQTDIRLRLNAVIELMALESRLNDRRGFERYQTMASASMHRMPPSMLVDFHFNTGMGLVRFGERYRSEEHLLFGLTVARQHSLMHWSRRIARELNLDDPRTSPPAP